MPWEWCHLTLHHTAPQASQKVWPVGSGMRLSPQFPTSTLLVLPGIPKAFQEVQARGIYWETLMLLWVVRKASGSTHPKTPSHLVEFRKASSYTAPLLRISEKFLHIHPPRKQQKISAFLLQGENIFMGNFSPALDCATCSQNWCPSQNTFIHLGFLLNCLPVVFRAANSYVCPKVTSLQQVLPITQVP